MNDFPNESYKSNTLLENTRKNMRNHRIEIEEDIESDGENQGRGKKKYSVIPQSVREKFIKRVLSKEVTIKEAAKEFGLKFSTSKAILQTYKKEGRIGKKKNRERKTKVVNAVFIANINPLAPQTSTISQMVSNHEIKGNKGSSGIEANKNKLIEQALMNNPEHRIVAQTQVQIPHDCNKGTQQFIKDLGQDFLKDFIEKNFGSNKFSNQQPNFPNISSNNLSNLSNLNSIPNLQSQAQLQISNPNIVSQLNNSNNTNITSQGNNSSSQQQHPLGNMPLNIPTINNTFIIPQPTVNLYSDLSHSNALNSLSNMNIPASNELSVTQKRSYSILERDSIPEFEVKGDQINDISVKRFRSGEDVLWDFDYDKSKKDLEDFIFRTHNAIKNSAYVEKMVSFDFSKYKDDFTDQQFTLLNPCSSLQMLIFIDSVPLQSFLFQ